MSDYMPEASQGESDSSSESSEVVESTAGESTGGESTGYNPSWNEAFDKIPIEQYREDLKPVFEKWDKNNNQRYEQVQQRFSPYEVLVENEVSIDDIKSAFELRNQLTQSPQDVFNRLAQHLGYDLSKLAPNAGDESQGLNDEYPEEIDPRLAELQKTQAGMLAYLQQTAEAEENTRLANEQAAQETAWFDQTKTGLDSIEEKYGKVDRNRVVQFAIWEAESKGTEVDLEAGFRAMQEFAKSAIQTSANATAPVVFGGNGALQSGRVDTSKMNEEEFNKYAVERIRAKNGG